MLRLVFVPFLFLVLHAGPARAETARHRVVAGDSLWTIARANGCTVDALRKANAMKPGDPLPVGRVLELPRCTGRVTGGSSSYVVQAGDTLSEIAARHSTTVEQLQKDNGLSSTTIRVGQTLAVGEGAPVVPLRLVAGQSVGRPQRGKLVKGALLPADSAYYRRHPDRVWGAQHVIDHVRRVVASVRRQYPGVHRLAIGDISAQRGGFISGHRSHQSGRDVDLGLYFERVPSGYPSEFVRAEKGRVHLAATWALLSALWSAAREPGGPARVFLDYGVQGELYEFARSHGVSKRELREIFQYPNGRNARNRFVSHEPKHDDHLHVRFRCAPKDTVCR
jgi:LysM repeat protein